VAQRVGGGIALL